MVEKASAQECLVLHHDEADGLASAALAKLTFEKLGFNPRLICLDKLYPEVVESIESVPGRIIVYADIGSGHIQQLKERNVARDLVIVLDHHDTVPSSDALVLNLNPELDGFSGEKDACSATVAYMFAKTVSRELAKYSYLARIGLVENPGPAQGLNLLAEREAMGGDQIGERSMSASWIDIGATKISPRKAATLLNVLGSVGYYQEGPRLGVEACTRGLDTKTFKIADDLEEKRKKANNRMLEKIRAGGLFQMKSIQWFHAKDNYQGMSGKVIGSFCSYLRYQRVINPVKYLVGMMNVVQEIPGWGRLSAPLVKVSGRAPQPLVTMIERGKRPPLSRVLPEACIMGGGFGDGHSVAASGVFDLGKEELFLNEFDRITSVES